MKQNLLKQEAFVYLTYCLINGKKKNDYKSLCDFYKWKERKWFIMHDELAVYLKKLRKSKCLTLKELSKQTGISRMTLSSYENGHTIPCIKLTKKLAEFYGIDPKEIVERTF